MRLATLLHLYLQRLRVHPIQELLAGVGIAIGAALVFAVLVANSSIAGSAKKVVSGVSGTADLQLTARDAHGFDQRLVDRIAHLPGVRRAAPVLEQRAIVAARNRHVSINLVSVDPSLASFAAPLTSNLAAGPLLFQRGLMLPSELARELGVPATAAQLATAGRLPRLWLEIRGRAVPVRARAILGTETIGPLAEARVALAPLAYVQEVSGLTGRVTRTLIDTKPGQEQEVRTELARTLSRRLTVAPANAEAELLEQAVRPHHQATTFFAAISALVGLLLAFNAMLLTAPERRRDMAELRVIGARPRDLAKLVLLHAGILGVAASLVGVIAGNVLSRTVFRETPAYLAPAFPLSTETVVSLQPVVLSMVGGIVVSCLAAVPLLFDLRRSRAADAITQEREEEPGHAIGGRTRRPLFLAASGLVVLATVVVLVAPSPALPATIGLAFAAVLAIPSTFTAMVRAVEMLAERAKRALRVFPLLFVATQTLRGTTLRSLALAATGALAVFGSVAIGGARHDLLRGIERYVSQYVGTADLWIVHGADDQATKDFPRGDLIRRIAAVPGVADVRAYQGSFLDFAGRRVWIIARPQGDSTMVPATEVITGNAAEATARVRGGGWITVSEQVAAERDVEPGDWLFLPTPSGSVRYRVAATTTNFGWSPGAVILNSRDFRRDWRTTSPTALEVDVRPGADPRAVRRAVGSALGPASALQVQSAEERAAQINGNARQGLQRLKQISGLLIVAAALAMAAAMAAALWQRRASLADRRLQGFRQSQLWWMMMFEAGVVLAAGCVTGTVTGLYGQALMDRYLRLTTGFPAPFTPAGWEGGEVFMLVLLAALASVAIPAYVASRVPARVALQD